MLSESTTFHQRDFSHKYIETHIYIFCYRNTFFVEYVLVVVVYDKKGISVTKDIYVRLNIFM